MISNQKLMKLIIVLLVACQSSAIISYYVGPSNIVLKIPKDLIVEGINVGDWEMRRGLAGKSDEVYFDVYAYKLPDIGKNVTTYTNDVLIRALNPGAFPDNPILDTRPNSPLHDNHYFSHTPFKEFPLTPPRILRVAVNSRTTGKKYNDAVWVLSQDEDGKLLINGKPAVDANNNPLATANRYELSFELERYKEALPSTTPYIKMIPSIIS